ncbi:MAG: glycosyltransferase family 10 [Planctomycetia bacterium]|nr:glycosyltransferase family 10 [Planctomycetia bacterium]RLT14969.1 MAG: glycosyltransferase [Planctomycetota bacterium]
MVNHSLPADGLTPSTGTDLRPTIRFKFVGFWDGFDPHDNFFTRLLQHYYQLDLCDSPDFILYTSIGKQRKDYQQYDCVRIFYTGENLPPDWNACDWAFTFEHTLHPRHFRLPHWPLYVDPHALLKPADYDPAAVLARKNKFCAFVVSNPLCRIRNDFFRRLSRYKPVDSAGKVLNTLGHRVADKQTFLADYKFTIAFENESHAGYTTEKVAQPMLVDSLPIYWGDPLVGRDFDTRSFLSAHDSQSLDELVERVIAVDRDPELHREILSRPWYRGNAVPPCADLGLIVARWRQIFSMPIKPVAERRGLGRLLRLDRLPASLASIRRRIVRKTRKLTRNA